LIGTTAVKKRAGVNVEKWPRLQTAGRTFQVAKRWDGRKPHANEYKYTLKEGGMVSAAATGKEGRTDLSKAKGRLEKGER
jgi:hypothetical protein